MKILKNRDLINRPEYLDKLIQNKDVDLVKIITGIRRCGKSSLLDLFENHLLEIGVPPANIIHMNLESLKYRHLHDYLDFYDYIAKQLNVNERYYLIFDEIQEIHGFEKAIESFRIDFDVDIYITGSNAYLLSSEFSTLLSGRYVQIKMLPLSFREFLDFYDFSKFPTIEQKFDKYLQFGGLPILRQYEFDAKRSFEALEGIYSTVVVKDILDRNESINGHILEKLMRFLTANVGSINSPNNIGNVLTNEGDIKGKSTYTTKTVSKYIDLLEKAYIIYSVRRFDVKGKQLLRTLGKQYIADLGFRSLLVGYDNTDRGHILENVVYLELLRRDYTVYIGKVGETEVDFIAEKADERLYIQVTESMLSEDVRKRELRPLQNISDNFEKIVLSMDRSFINSYNGIKSLNVIDWLVE